MSDSTRKCENVSCSASVYLDRPWCAFHAGRPTRYVPSLHNRFWGKSVGVDHIVSFVQVETALFEVLVFEASDGVVTNWVEVDGLTNLTRDEAFEAYHRLCRLYTD